MTLTGHSMLGASNDAVASAPCPNDQQRNLLAAKIASVAAEKAKKEAADKAAAEFKAKAERDARDLEGCRAEIIKLKAQLQEAQDAAKDSISTSATAKSTIESLQNDFTSKTTELSDAKAEITTLVSKSSELRKEISALTTSRDELQSQLSQRTSERDYYLVERNQSNEENKNLRKYIEARESELDGGDVTVRSIWWGPRHLTDNETIRSKVKEYIKNGRDIPCTNDFFGVDPDVGKQKWGSIIFCKSHKIGAWENGRASTT